MTDRRTTNHRGSTKKRYHIIYADLPWRYECKKTGAAEHHYLTMSIDELCALPVETLAGDLTRVELFARQKAPGWDVWGNEVDSDLSLTPQETVSETR